MLHVSIHSPRSRVTVHPDSQCRHVKEGLASDTRRVDINPDSVIEELHKFREGEYPFKSQASLNGMWLRIDFCDQDFERLVAEYVVSLLGKRYDPIKDATVRDCRASRQRGVRGEQH